MFNQFIKVLTIIISFNLSGIIATVFAQSPEVFWDKTFGGIESDEANAVSQTSDGGFIVFGSTSSSGLGGSDIWLIRTDSLGNTLWTKTIGFDQLEQGLDGQETFNGDLIVTGSTNSFSKGDYDVFLARTDSSGDTLWTKHYGTTGYESGNAVFQTPNGGGFVIAGVSGASVTDQHDVYLVKTNSSGHLQWDQTIKTPFDDGANDVRQNSNGDYIITGYTKSSGAGNYDVWLICVDPSGNVLWNKTFGGNQEDVGQALVQTSDGGCAITGWTYSFGSGLSDVYLVRADASGDTLWTKTYGESSTYDGGYSIAKTSDGGFIISGTTVSPNNSTQDVLIIRTDSLGNEIWKKIISENGAAAGYAIRKTIDDGYIVGGIIEPTNRTDTDALLIRLGSEQTTEVNDKSTNNIFQYKLSQNYPNPFNPVTIINYQLTVNNFVSLKVYDILGTEVATLVNEEKPAGSYKLEFNASKLSSGVYFYQLKAGNFVDTKKLVLMK
jgi:Secretion system C-terminal sorting domain